MLAEVTGGAGTRPLGTFSEQIGELIGHYGSESKLAAAAGIRRSTFWRWKTGRTKPKPSSLASIAAQVRGARVRNVPGDQGVTLHVTEWRSSKRDGSTRTITGKQLGLRAGTMDKVVEAYRATGDPEVMARVFLAGVTVGFYRQALGAGLDPAPAGPVDVGGGGAGVPSGGGGGSDDDDDDFGELDDEDAIYDMYDDYVDDLAYEGHDVPDDGGSFGFAVG